MCICVSNGVDDQGGGRGGLISYSISAKSTPPLLCPPMIFLLRATRMNATHFDAVFDEVWQVQVALFSVKVLSI